MLSSWESLRVSVTSQRSGRYVRRRCSSSLLNIELFCQAFWDATGQLWAAGSLAGKYAGLFVSTAGQGGGQESTAVAALSTLVHHGIIYVPLGYAPAFPQLTNLQEIHGGKIQMSRACVCHPS